MSSKNESTNIIIRKKSELFNNEIKEPCQIKMEEKEGFHLKKEEDQGQIKKK